MRRTTTLCWLVSWFVFSTGAVQAQSIRSLVNGGNSLYKEKKFDDAEVQYRKALEQEKGLTAGKFNLGNALYKQGKFDESLREYGDVASTQVAPPVRANALYNQGNALMKAEKYQEAVQSYIESLKLKPDDQDTKYNLSYALERLKQQQQQQKQDKSDKNDKNDKDQKNKDQQKQQDQKNDQQKQDQQKQQQDQQQNQQQAARQEKRMSKQDAERILEVLKNSERDVQKKLRVRQATRAKTDKDW